MSHEELSETDYFNLRVSKALYLLDENALPQDWTFKVYAALNSCTVSSVTSLILFERTCRRLSLMKDELLGESNYISFVWIACLSLALKLSEDKGAWICDVCNAALEGDCESVFEYQTHWKKIMETSKKFEIEVFRIFDYDVGVSPEVFETYVAELKKLDV